MKRRIPVLVAICGFAFITPYSSGQYVDPATGLGWLSLTQTADWTINEVLAAFEEGESLEFFRYATSDEVFELFGNLGYTPFLSNEELAPVALNIYDAIGTLFDLFVPDPEGIDLVRKATQGFSIASQSSPDSYFFFAVEYNQTPLAGDDIPRAEIYGYEVTGPAPLDWDPGPYVGHFLISTAIPEPSEIGLMIAPLGIGLILLIRRRCKK